MMKPIVVQEVDTAASSSEASALRRRIASLEKRNMRLEEEKWFRRETSTTSTTSRYREDYEVIDDDTEILQGDQNRRKAGPMSQATAEQIQWVAELIHGSAARAESLCSSTAVSSVTSSEVRVSISPAQSCSSIPTSRSASPAAAGSCLVSPRDIPLKGLLPPSLQKEEDDYEDATLSETSQPRPLPTPTITVVGPTYPPYLPSDFSPVSAVTSASSTTPIDGEEEDSCPSDGGCIVPLIPTSMMLPPVPLAPRTLGKHRRDRFMPLRVIREEGMSLMTPVIPLSGVGMLNTSLERSPSMVGGSPSNASIHEFSTSHRRPTLNEEGEDSSGGFPSDVIRPYAVRPDFRLSPFDTLDSVGTRTSPPHACSLSSSLTEKTLSCMTPIISSADPSDDYTSPVTSTATAKAALALPAAPLGHTVMGWGCSSSELDLYNTILEWMVVAEDASRRAVRAEEHAEWVEVFDMGVMKLASEALQPLIDTLLLESRQSRTVIRKKRISNERRDTASATTPPQENRVTSDVVADAAPITTTSSPPEVEVVEGGDAVVGGVEVGIDPRDGDISPDMEALIRDVGLSVIGSP